MECNKDEAIRAILIAERKLIEKDFAGAKKIVLKAQTLYPGLEGLPQMLTTLDVYIAAEKKISGEVDWYGILGINPYADDETVKKQYRKLALMLHPDKNKVAGAEGAFKLLSEAWSLISDKAKRLAYNQRRGSRGFQQKVQTKAGGPSANGFPNFPSSVTSNLKTDNNTAWARPPSARPPSRSKIETFWTICYRCKMHYEHLRMYINCSLLCPNCQRAYLASETAPPANFSKPFNSSSGQSYQNPGHHATNGNLSDPGRYAGPRGSAGLNSSNHVKVQQDQFTRTTGVGTTVSSPSTDAKAATVIQQANERLKRAREETQAAGAWEKLLRQRNGHQTAMGNDFGFGNGGLNRDRVHAYGFSGNYSKPNSTRELTPLEIQNMLVAKARTEICKKLCDLTSANLKKEKLKNSKKEKEKTSVKGGTHELNGKGVSCGTSGEGADKEVLGTAAISVPDPDFHDFDLDRTEGSFGDNQVWSAYDNDDGMPRFYALIHEVISLEPFKMRISWLNSKTSNEFSSTLDWIGSGFFKTCGDFRAGRPELTNSLNSFSHKVKWTKGPRGTVSILPKKGEVWALYRNWAPDWNEHTPNEVIHKYDMVEVIEEYNEDQVVIVAPLIKFAGFKTVFHRNTDHMKVRRIPKKEMFRFSHLVPSYLLTGLEAQNSPKDCLELDPAAIPSELLQIFSEADVGAIEQNDGKAEKERLHRDSKICIDMKVTDSADAKEQ